MASAVEARLGFMYTSFPHHKLFIELYGMAELMLTFVLALVYSVLGDQQIAEIAVSAFAIILYTCGILILKPFDEQTELMIQLFTCVIALIEMVLTYLGEQANSDLPGVPTVRFILSYAVIGMLGVSS